MVELKLISISDIVVPERLRAVEEEHALAIARSIVEHGLINPITVRSTSASVKSARKQLAKSALLSAPGCR
jgi:ParB family chromosome partitioning protein